MLRGLPEVSVVLASYNHAAFIQEAITSVLNQTISNLELIIVDDASTDDTAKIVQKVKDDRIQFIRLEQNRLVNPRNVGIARAKGKYIAFQNSDDAWNSNKLEKQLAEFRRNPKLSACFTDIQLISKNGTVAHNSLLQKQFARAKNRPRVDWLRLFFDTGNCLCISSAVIRKKSLKKIGLFDESLFQLADLDLWVRCAGVGDLYVVKDKLTSMRVLGTKNLSYPTDDAARRSSNEFAQILENYTQEPFIKSLRNAFADTMPKGKLESQIQLAYLALFAWRQEVPHRLFADRMFAKLIAHPENRKLISEHFGPGIIKQFIEERGRLEVIVR